MNLLKQLISFIYPLKIKTIPSERSGALEVTLVNGKLVIDSENANYSYGSLQRVLKKGLSYIGKQKLKQLNSILILGVAGGSVIQTLRKDFKLHTKITGVEIDADVIELANTYFQLYKTPNLELITEDAFKYIRLTKHTYDLIIIDVFNDTQMPSELFEDTFWEATSNLLNDKGLCLFNTLYSTQKELDRNNKLKALLTPLFSNVESLKTNQINEIILVHK
ncbi:MAG: spermidine synthase [Flavobacteriaceae bacterium]